jgi:hypothetical protein
MRHLRQPGYSLALCGSLIGDEGDGECAACRRHQLNREADATESREASTAGQAAGADEQEAKECAAGEAGGGQGSSGACLWTL